MPKGRFRQKREVAATVVDAPIVPSLLALGLWPEAATGRGTRAIGRSGTRAPGRSCREGAVFRTRSSCRWSGTARPPAQSM